MEDFIFTLIEFAPAVALLLYLNWRQDQRNEKLVNAMFQLPLISLKQLSEDSCSRHRKSID